MNYEDINYNEVIVSGIISNITDTDDMYIKFSIIHKKHIKTTKSIYVSLSILRKLYNKYLDYFKKGNKVFIKGYLNSYLDKNNEHKSFISVTNVSDNPKEIIDERKEPHIRYDSDGVMIWNGKRCESEYMSEEEKQEFRKEINGIIDEINKMCAP